MLDNIKVGKKSSEWKRINMRNVVDLLAVEFIHDLYNRHDPKINSIRFRHTVTVWKDGVVNSYAPVKEWERLGQLVGYQYYSLNPIVIEHTRNLYRRKRESFHAFMRRVKKIDFPSLSNNELAALIINFQSLVLGELYVLNFVQVEHGLNTAVWQIIEELVPDKASAKDSFTKLIQTEIPTASEKERRKLYYLAQKWKFLKKLSLYQKAKAEKDVYKHYESYKYLYSAYGAAPKSFEDFLRVFQDYFQHKEIVQSRSIFPRLLAKEARQELKKLKSAKLNVLVPLLVQGGVFRDTNKALLGLSVKYRFLMLDEIARRGIESRDNLNFYLLSEIAALLRDAKKLGTSEIKSRRKYGVVLERNEDFQLCTEDIFLAAHAQEEKKVFSGQCASPGLCTGACKIILTKEDAHKVKEGDIMVAIGTDFDLIEAMHRSAAVITEEGGILSHASVVCRELKKPCCIGVKEATHLLRDGQLIRINATQGKIEVIG